MNKKPLCISCSEEYSVKRKLAGYATCMSCGDKLAQKQIHERSKRVGIGYNKGGFQLLGATDERARDAMKDAGRKTRNELETATVRIKTRNSSQTVKIAKRRPKIRRKRIGVMYINGDKCTWYEGQDPEKLGATRWAKI